MLKITLKLPNNKQGTIFVKETYKADRDYVYTEAGKISRKDILRVDKCDTKENGQSPD